MSAAELRLARDEAISTNAPWPDVLAALNVIDRKLALAEAKERNDAWSHGLRGDGVARIPWLGDTLTGLLRRFAACGVVRHSEVDELHRHVSELRRRLKRHAGSIRIDTLVGEGYELVGGFDALFRLLRPGPKRELRLAGFTVKQTAILELLWKRGSLHVDQIPCLQRHMSNIRARLPKNIEVKTHSGEGLYTLARGREALAKLFGADAPVRKKEAAQVVAMSR